MRTLARVAIGVAVAKGANAMMKKGSSTGGSGGLGGLLGGLAGGTGTRGQSGGSLQDILGGVLGGKSGSGSGGLGGLLNQLGGGKSTGSAGGSLGGLLGGLAGAAGAGGLLGGLAQKTNARPERPEADFGAVLNSQFDSNPTPAILPSRDQEATAALMIAAMIQAAKSDGTFDEGEREKLLKHLGDVNQEEAAFVRAQMNAPVDVEGLVAQTPDGMGPQIYGVSVLAIDLDTQDEAQYLHKLATAYGMTPAAVNDIHSKLGVQSLYT